MKIQMYPKYYQLLIEKFKKKKLFSGPFRSNPLKKWVLVAIKFIEKAHQKIVRCNHGLSLALTGPSKCLGQFNTKENSHGAGNGNKFDNSSQI